MDRQGNDVVDAKPDEEKRSDEEERSDEEASSGLATTVTFVAAISTALFGLWQARSVDQESVAHRPHVAYQGTVLGTRREPPPPSTPGTVIPKDAEKYKMDHKERGVALIFYHKTFDRHRRHPRIGTEADRDKLKLAFRKLGFNVKCHEDLSLSDIEKILQEEAAQQHEERDCLAVAVLTYSGLNQMLAARDEDYDVSKLMEPFIGSSCPGLVTKPKLFFIQTCKGEYSNLVHQMHGGGDIVDGAPDQPVLRTYRVPSHADILIWYATFDEQYCKTNYRELSCVRCLYSALEKRDTSVDLVSLLTDVTRQFGELGFRREKVPCFTSSLTRLLYFP